METLTQATAPTTATKPVAPAQVQPCDFRASNTADKARLAPLVAVNESFARNLSQVLSSRLGLTCEVNLQTSDQVACRTFLEKLGASSHLISLHLEPQHEIAVLQIDPMLLFPIVDLLLGGSGKPGEITREVTDIEDQIAKDLVKIICQELQNAWRSFNVEVKMGTRQACAPLQQTFSATEKGLAFRFAAVLPEGGGEFQLLLPVSSSAVFLRTGPTEAHVAESSKKHTMSPKLAEKLLDSAFGLDLTLFGGKVQANDLLNLAVGKILALGISVRTPVVLQIGGRDAFEAIPVRSGHHRGAHLIDRVAQSSQEIRSAL